MDNARTHEEGHHHYIAPQSLLLKVLVVLIFFTVLTVVTGTADWIPGWMHVPLALGIASIKVTLVVLIFMGLKHDNRVNSLIFILSGIFVTIFLVFTLFDTAYRGDLTNVDTMTISDRQLLERADSLRAVQYINLRVAPGDFALTDSAEVSTVEADAPGTENTEVEENDGELEAVGPDDQQVNGGQNEQ